MYDVSDIRALLNVFPPYCSAPSGPQIRKRNKVGKVLATCPSNGLNLLISTFGAIADSIYPIITHLILG